MLLTRPEHHSTPAWASLHRNPSPGALRPPPDSPSPTVAATGTARTVTAAAYRETLQLEIVTREGDRVQVDVRQMMAGLSAREAHFAARADTRGAVVLASRTQLEAGAFEARFGLHVQGDLDEEEMAALKRIFDQVGRLADRFFQGDLQAAVQAARRLRVDGSQIGKLDLDMTQQVTQVSYRRRAVAAYAAVAQPGNGPHPLKAAMQVDRYWQQVEQVQATIQQTFRSFSLSIETLMAGGEQRTVATIEETHRQIREMVGEVRELLGLPAEAGDRIADGQERTPHREAAVAEAEPGAAAAPHRKEKDTHPATDHAPAGKAPSAE